MAVSLYEQAKWVIKNMLSLRALRMVATDERVRVMTEVLGGIRVTKLNGWEVRDSTDGPFLSRTGHVGVSCSSIISLCEGERECAYSGVRLERVTSVPCAAFDSVARARCSRCGRSGWRRCDPLK